MFQEREVAARGVRLSVFHEETEIGRAYLYILSNDLHTPPFGLLEDVFVHEKHRSRGVAGELLQAVIAHARAEKCYKLIATSRDDGSREPVHYWYQRLGFRSWGTEFRMDL